MKEPEKERRALVIGSTGRRTGTVQIPWSDESNRVQLADFDVVILNLGQPDTVIGSARMPGPEMLARAIFSKSTQVVVIGHPLALVAGQNIASNLPVFPGISEEGGEVLRVVEPRFANYFKNVRRWEYHTTNREFGVPKATLAEILRPQGRGFEFQVVPIAEARNKEAVGFRVVVAVTQSNGATRVDPAINLETGGNLVGHFLWLPRVTEIDQAEAIDQLLVDVFKFGGESAPPEWAAVFKTPDAAIAEARTDELRTEFADVRARLEASEADLAQAQRFVRLLFETGDELETLVLDGFRELGATVEELPHKGKEDGRFMDPFGRRYLIEVKGKEGALQLRDLRQLNQWWGEAVADEDHPWDSKAVCVANAYRLATPGSRPPPDYAIGVAAQRFRQAILTTAQLFEAICRKQRGALDLRAFWDALDETLGTFTLPQESLGGDPP